MYKMNVANVPLMKQAGQVEVGAHVSPIGYDGQAAVAITNYIAVLANGSSTLGENKISYSATNYSYNTHSFGEIGAGYYKNLENDYEFEIYGIAGNGSTYYYVKSSTDENAHSVNYSRFALQANLAHSHEKWEVAVTPRLLFVHFYDVFDTNPLLYASSPKNYLYFDSYATIKYLVLPFLKVTAQVGASVPITGLSYAYYQGSPLNCSLGIVCNLNLIKPH